MVNLSFFRYGKLRAKIAEFKEISCGADEQINHHISRAVSYIFTKARYNILASIGGILGEVEQLTDDDIEKIMNQLESSIMRKG